MNHPKDLLRKYRIAPKKRLGQHFITDPDVLGRIVELAAVGRDDAVLEIGAGLGSLTEALAGRAASVIACETDPAMVRVLERELGGTPGLQVRLGDAMRLDYRSIAGECGGCLKLVANLPYQISTPLLFKLLEQREAFTSLTLMFQKELALRIAAAPGRPGYGALTVFINLWTDVRHGFDVSRTSFYPPPAVDSTVLRFEVFRTARVPIADEPFFREIVRSAFAYRRKTLVNCLKRSEAVRIRPTEAVALLRALGLDPKIRAQALDLESFAALADELKRFRVIRQ